MHVFTDPYSRVPNKSSPVFSFISFKIGLLLTRLPKNKFKTNPEVFAFWRSNTRLQELQILTGEINYDKLC